MKHVLFFILTVSTASAALPWFCSDCERDGSGKIKRSAAAVRAFKRANPLPAECKIKGERCVVDHIVPLACSTGPAIQKQLDSPANMQWQTRAASATKDRWELDLCAMNTGQRIALGIRYGQVIPRALARIGAKK